MSYVSSVGAYAGAAPITPARTNPDYAASKQTERATQPDQQRANFGPATNVTLSPEAQAYLQGQKADQAKASQVTRAEDADTQAKAEKASASNRAYEAQSTAQAKAASLQG